MERRSPSAVKAAAAHPAGKERAPHLREILSQLPVFRTAWLGLELAGRHVGAASWGARAGPNEILRRNQRLLRRP
jgi:hypothetical protein